ncbi:cathepsin B-like proteinase, partial [Aphelenchoides avenae]
AGSGSATPGAVMRQQVRSNELRSMFRAATIENYDDTPIPKEFDLRSQYPQCADVIGHITNQGFCGDCWAHAATGVMSDRICIQSNGTQKAQLSATELLSCCEICTKHPPELDDEEHKCSGGFSTLGYKYWVFEGVVTEQCQPNNLSLTE